LKPLVMDNRFFILSLTLIGLLALFGSTALPFLGMLFLTIDLQISSRSNPEEVHNIKIMPKEKRVSCDCLGFKFHGYCSHIKFYKKMIRRVINDSTN